MITPAGRLFIPALNEKGTRLLSFPISTFIKLCQLPSGPRRALKKFFKAFAFKNFFDAPQASVEKTFASKGAYGLKLVNAALRSLRSGGYGAPEAVKGRMAAKYEATGVKLAGSMKRRWDTLAGKVGTVNIAEERNVTKNALTESEQAGKPSNLGNKEYVVQRGEISGKSTAIGGEDGGGEGAGGEEEEGEVGL